MTRLLPILIIATICGALCAKGDDLTSELKRLNVFDGSALRAMGNEYMAQAKYDSARICYTAVTSRAITNDINQIRDRITSLGCLAYLYMSCYFDSRSAYNCLMEAMELAEEYGQRDLMGYLLINNVYVAYCDNILSGGVSHKLIPSAVNAFDYLCDDGPINSLIAATSNLLEIGIETHDTTFVCDRLRKFRKREIPDGTNLKDYIIDCCNGMDAYIRQDYEYAAGCFIEASRNVVINVNPKQSIISALSCAAEVYMQCGQYDLAESALTEAISLSADSLNHPMALPLYGKLSRLYEIKGDKPNSTRVTMIYLQLKDSLINTSKIGNSNETEFQYNLKKAERETWTLNERNRHQTLLLTVAVLVVCVLVVCMFFLHRMYRRNRESYRIIYLSYKELSEKQKRKELSGAGHLEQSKSVRYKGSPLSEDDIREIYERVIDVMETSQEIYDVNFSVERLSELVDSKQPRYVSEAINRESGSNFSTLLNKYRIREACRRFDNVDTYGRYTVEYIAKSVGFKSRSAFSSVFKSITRLTPAVYQSIAKKSSKQ